MHTIAGKRKSEKSLFSWFSSTGHILDTIDGYNMFYSYHNCNFRKSANRKNPFIRGCTGFDGGFEVAEAIRGLGPRHQLRIKFKRRRKFSVRCLVAAVDLKLLAA